jgi:putative tricarboxylic transport membrane protein
MKKIVIVFALLFNLVSAVANMLPKNVQVILPYGPGGSADLQFRHLQQYLVDKGITANPIYKPGANGIIAMQDLSRANKDGSVISITAGGIIANAEIQNKTKVADPLTITGVTLHALITNPNGRYKTLNLLETALKTSDVNFNMGYHAVGNLLIMDRYFAKLGVTSEVTKVPYKTSVDSSTAIVGGHLQSAFVPMATASPLAKEGKVLILAVAGPRSFKAPQGVVSFSARWSDWRPLDAFMIAAPPGWDTKTTEAWLSILEEYYRDSRTHEFYEKSYLSIDTFGPDQAQRIVSSALKEVENIKK